MKSSMRVTANKGKMPAAAERRRFTLGALGELEIGPVALHSGAAHFTVADWVARSIPIAPNKSTI